ncbi:LacI family DNA-binding transcriptional regulator [Prevotella sp. lc2012]|uniref:LacI family DNA-binding transcriptional regulator n=1 Tax=Prevotella sp. lc2012 TaxID=1761886 RepID=UPI00089BAF7E|nr:LacI family DNA-binding transcriptional regulator [Prevotella sp. lc2012]SEE02385.1 transcriptional regulator, LacI family [Prevotella sp. lc2012]
MPKENITIKDIAARAGVSTGTVDRVLHNRPNVSKSSLEKVNKALAEMDYRPNMYASALAYNKTYDFYIVLPKHEQEAYWDEIEEGAQACTDFRRDFGISLKFVYYERFNHQSFTKMARELFTAKIDGVIIVPSTLEQTSRFTQKLMERKIPYVLLDSYMPDLKPLAFFGQDSFASGYFAARMLMLIASKEKEIAIVKQTRDGNVGSKQQANRETGFRHYMVDHFPEIKISEVDLPLDEERKEYDTILEKFFKAHPQIHHCITFNSKAHLVGEFLQRSNRRDIQIMGYDMVHKNEECVRQGSISFLIAQHAYQQGYASVNALFEAIVMKRAVTPVNYMPIEILTKENVAFYRRTAI